MDNKEYHIKELLRKYREGSCTKEELDELLTHFDKGDALRHLLKSMKNTFEESMSEQEPVEEVVSHRMKRRLLQELKADKTRLSGRREFKWWKLSAAAAVLVFMLGYWALLHENNQTEWQSVVTVSGEHKTVLLPDSSTVLMNGNSEIKFPKKFDGSRRVIKLQGEAFFTIRPDSLQPFYVVGKDFTTKVLGTSFNIDTELDPSVSVSTGIVQVVRISEKDSEKTLVIQNKAKAFLGIASKDIDDPWNDDKHDLYAKVQLTANEKASIAEHSSGWIKEEEGNNNNWHKGEMAFYNEEIELIVKGLERYYGARISVSDAMRHCEVTLPLKNKNLDQAIQVLAQLSGASVRKNGGVWYLDGGGCGF